MTKTKKWAPTNEQNLGVITETYEFINEKLLALKKETNCPDEFIHNFLRSIQKEWHAKSCKSKVRNF